MSTRVFAQSWDGGVQTAALGGSMAGPCPRDGSHLAVTWWWVGAGFVLV